MTDPSLHFKMPSARDATAKSPTSATRTILFRSPSHWRVYNTKQTLYPLSPFFSTSQSQLPNFARHVWALNCRIRRSSFMARAGLP